MGNAFTIFKDLILIGPVVIYLETGRFLSMITYLLDLFIVTRSGPICISKYIFNKHLC